MNIPVHIIEDVLEDHTALSRHGRRQAALAIYNALLEEGWHFLGHVPKGWRVTVEPKS